MTRLPGPPEWPAVEGADSERLILRDGSVALVRRATSDDAASLQRFFKELSAESRYQRFMAAGEPAPAVIDQLCATCHPADRLTLVALRQEQDSVHPVAVASYVANTASAADVAFAVADKLHGKGLATGLLERLAAEARRHGIERFDATTLAGNSAMLEVFHDSGFELRSKSSQGVVELQLDLRLSATGAAAVDERNRVATMASLRPLLQPRAVAVLGVSRDPSNLGHRLFLRLVDDGFRGSVYPVNPHADEVAGRRCYASVRDVPPGVDLAVIATGRNEVLQAVDDCAAAGVRSLVVITAGFAEAGEEGRALQQRLLEAVRARGMRMVGPNCMGVLNLTGRYRMNASFAERLPPAGRLTMASQSGGVGLALLDLARARRLGLSTCVSLGNKADVSGNDLLQWGEGDPDTSVILLYLESIGNPRRFAQIARRVGRSKPIVVVKAGRTRSGSKAAGSHTAGLASSEAAVDALCKQTGIIRVDTIDEMFDVAELLDLQPLPPGAKVGIVTNAGGPGILAADACESSGLVVPAFSDETRRRLSAKLPATASVGNPVDLVASAGPEAYEDAILTSLASQEIDTLLVVYTPIDHARSEAISGGIGRAVARARAGGITGKPVALCVLEGGSQPAPLAAGDERIPAYMFPENAARALRRALTYADWRAQPPAPSWTFDDVYVDEGRRICQRAITARGNTWLTAQELHEVLDAFGLDRVASGTARSAADAVTRAARFGYPVVMKVQSPGVLHKTEAGGVRMHLYDERGVRDAFDDFSSRFPEILDDRTDACVVVQPMLAGVEVLIGVSEDPVFGPLVAFGLGGVNAELLRDVAFRIAPLTDGDVDGLLHDVRSYPLLEGYRGRPAMDVASLRNVLRRVSLLAQHLPELRELDLNPVIVLPASGGCRIVDARARVA
jgi:acetyl coenzyme A synthetase (ADP forming)-like protein